MNMNEEIEDMEESTQQSYEKWREDADKAVAVRDERMMRTAEAKMSDIILVYEVEIETTPSKLGEGVQVFTRRTVSILGKAVETILATAYYDIEDANILLAERYGITSKQADCILSHFDYGITGTSLGLGGDVGEYREGKKNRPQDIEKAFWPSAFWPSMFPKVIGETNMYERARKIVEESPSDQLLAIKNFRALCNMLGQPIRLREATTIIRGTMREMGIGSIWI